MDFSKFDSRSASEIGRPMHIKDPVTGEPITDEGKPCIVYVKGTEAASFHAAQKAARTAEMEGDKTSADIADIHAKLVKGAVPLITGFENVHRQEDGKFVPLTEADAEWFLNLQMIGNDKEANERTFVFQVINFARDRANILGNEPAA